ncbi:sister chromatid cohesion protein Dcc1 [Mucidula mucida]|nr:sister chromatid cohesion protein Dcc1 [Mucidula mucida]
MAEHELCFSSQSTAEASTFKLVELPPELCTFVERSIADGYPVRFTIRGQGNDDAVLCTSTSTYIMRTVNLSNSVLVVTPPDASSMDLDDDKLVIRDQVNEIIELTPSVPKLHKLASLLKGSEYDETSVEEDEDDSNRTRILYDSIRETIQASDAELERGLRDRRILNIHGELRPISPVYLKNILEMILNQLVSDCLSHKNASVEQLCNGLADVHEVPRSVSTQVMSWFGEIRQGFWQMDVDSVVREVGLNLLRPHRHTAIDKDELVSSWKSAVGDTFEASVSLDLLAGNYLSSSTLNDDVINALKYFPSYELPIEPTRRFADLFLTRSRWKSDDIAPFLSDIAVDSKERDKLLLKYARAITDPQGIWYTARVQYNG